VCHSFVTKILIYQQDWAILTQFWGFVCRENKPTPGTHTNGLTLF